MSCRVRSFGGRRARAFVAGGYQLSLLNAFGTVSHIHNRSLTARP